jgi:hypothetical protein
MKDRRHVLPLLIGAYIVVVSVLTIPAVLLLVDGGVPTVVAVILGVMLAQIALIALLIPVRIYLALRSRKDRNSN